MIPPIPSISHTPTNPIVPAPGNLDAVVQQAAASSLTQSSLNSSILNNNDNTEWWSRFGVYPFQPGPNGLQ